MFELFSGDRRRVPHRGTLPVLISTAAHVIVVGVLLAIPILYVSAEVPEVPDVLAFVASAPPPPPPPPPPPRRLHQLQGRPSRRRQASADGKSASRAGRGAARDCRGDPC